MTNNKEEMVYTVRQGRIIEIEKGTSSNIEYEHPSRLDAIKSQVVTGNTHNFSELDKKLMNKALENIAQKKGYSLVKEHDNSYTVINQYAQEEIKNVREPYIFKELNKIEDMNSLEKRLDRLEFMGEMNRIDSLKHSLNNEFDKIYENIDTFSQKRDYFDDPEKGNNKEKSDMFSEEIHHQESEFIALMKIAKKYDVEIDHPYEDLSHSSVPKEKHTPEKKINFAKFAKEFRKQSPKESIQHKSKGIER